MLQEKCENNGQISEAGNLVVKGKHKLVLGTIIQTEYYHHTNTYHSSPEFRCRDDNRFQINTKKYLQ